MLHQVSERQMRLVRWVLVLGWIGLIVSLFYDPISHYWTDPNHPTSIFRLNPALFDPSQCRQVLTVQGECLDVAPYPLGARIFWGWVVPSAVLIILVLGHETWRRICPLSFLSQIPRSLGIQRQRKIVDPRTGSVRYELAKVSKDSWLGRNYLYFQFGLLCLGLCLRILLVDANRLLLGSFLVLTIVSAILVGYLFAGKSWCQYFCPMAPVQMVINGPRSLLGSEAHQGQRQAITQSMCRTVDQEGKEKSACVGCQSPCMDIDAERNYWESQTKPGRKFIQYGYLGLVLGFFLYYFLYSGTLKFAELGAWAYQPNPLDTLFDPGFYIAGQAIPIPRLVAAPLTLATFVGISYFLLSRAEKAYRGYRQAVHKPLTREQAQHHLFALATLLAFNSYFVFAGRPLVRLFRLHPNLEIAIESAMVLLSTLLFYRTWGRSPELYTRESLASSLRKQLSKLSIDFSRFLEGRAMSDLKPDEVYVLAKVLPSFNKESSLLVYKGMLREALEQGTVDPANSLEGLKQVRLELGIKEEEHFNFLTELSVETPELLDPTKRRSRENQLRIESYRQSLEQQLLVLTEMGVPLRDALKRKQKQIQLLRQEYGITAEEQEQLLSHMIGENSALLRKAEHLLNQLKELTVQDQILGNLVADANTPVFTLLRTADVQQKQQIVTNQLLNILEVLENTTEVNRIADSLGILAENVLPGLLQASVGPTAWQKRLSGEAIARLQPAHAPISSPVASEKTPVWVAGEREFTATEVADRRTVVAELLHQMLHDLEPLTRAAALYALNQLDAKESQKQAKQMLDTVQPGDWLVRETAERILEQSKEKPIEPTLIVELTEADQSTPRIFQKPAVCIGRSPDNDIILTNPQIAPRHAILYFDEIGVSLAVLSGKGDVWVNQARISGVRQPLQQPATLWFNESRDPSIVVRWEQPASTEHLTETPSTLEKLLLIFQMDLFRSVRPESLIDLARQAEIQVYAPGTPICRVGEPSDQLILLIEGSADVVVMQEDVPVVVNSIQTGETIGEMGVLTRQPRSANVIAKAEYNQTLIINANDFETVLRNDSEVTRNLLLSTINRLQHLIAQFKA